MVGQTVEINDAEGLNCKAIVTAANGHILTAIALTPHSRWLSLDGGLTWRLVGCIS